MKEETIIITYLRLNEKERRESYLATNSLSILHKGLIAVGYSHFAVLRENGTVAAYGNNEYGQCNVDGWKDVMKIAAGNLHTVALRKDGSVVATGSNRYGQCNVTEWKDITELFADKGFTVGITSKGEIMVTHAQSRSATESITNLSQKVVNLSVEKPTNKTTDNLRELYKYHVKNKKAIIDKYLGNEESVTVPTFLLGYPVEIIGESAFENSNLKKLTISVKTIRKYAFAYCKNLESIQFVSGLEEIESYAFMSCTKIENIVFPRSVKSLGTWAFLGCTNLKFLTGPSVLSTQKQCLGTGVQIIYR